MADRVVVRGVAENLSAAFGLPSSPALVINFAMSSRRDLDDLFQSIPHHVFNGEL